MASFEIERFLKKIYSLFYFILILEYHSDVHQIVQGYDCFRQRFPLTLGFPSGDTDIRFIDLDPLTGYIYMVGTTTATEIKVPGAVKSVFIASHSCLKFNFIKVIQHAEVDTVEYMSLMGNSSTNLLVYTTSSINPYVPLFYQINKIDGSINSTFYLNDT